MAKRKEGQPTDYRAERKREDRNLLFIILGMLVLFGGGLIWLIWGVGALLGALPFLVLGGIMIVVGWGFFALLERMNGD